MVGAEKLIAKKSSKPARIENNQPAHRAFRLTAATMSAKEFRDAIFVVTEERACPIYNVGEEFRVEGMGLSVPEAKPVCLMMVRELMQMNDCDHFDLFAHYGYREKALKRVERKDAYLTANAAWFDAMDGKAAIVLRGLGHQFGIGGTDELESTELWNVPEIRRAGGLTALKGLGKPVDVLREAKTRLFGV